MKRDISIILSLIALVGVIILAMLWCCRSMSLSAVSLDTFIGVMKLPSNEPKLTGWSLEVNSILM